MSEQSASVPVLFSFTNLSRDADPEGLLQFMMDNSSGQQWYRRAPPPPGVIRGAALDLLTIVSVGGSLATIAQLFWATYDRFIAPKRTRENSGIYIAIGGPTGTRIWLGADVLEREDFIKVFVSGISEMGSEENTEVPRWEVEIQSGYWVEIERDKQ
jgi:hypothetical protein